MKPSEVLLVEDNAGDALLITQILEESPIPVRLHLARDGMEALHMLATEVWKPDLVILDLNLPKISGCGVLEEYHPRDVPVVVFTSSWNDAEKQRSLDLGAQEFIRKPMHLQAYREAVSGMVERWTQRNERPQ